MWFLFVRPEVCHPLSSDSTSLWTGLAIGYKFPTIRAFYGRIKRWCGSLFVSVSIACHLKPCMRFSLTRLSDNLLPTALKRLPHIFSYLDTKSTLFHWLNTTFEIHTAHALCISSVFVCNIPVSINSSHVFIKLFKSFCWFSILKVVSPSSYEWI